MKVTGLEYSNYLSGNPVQVKITADGNGEFKPKEVINLDIKRKKTFPHDRGDYSLPTMRLYTKPEGVTLDVAKIIKGLMPTPYITNSNLETGYIPNYQRFDFSFSHESGQGQSVSYTDKNFIRGFERSRDNVGHRLQHSQTLTKATAVPTWEGYPTGVAYLKYTNQVYWAEFSYNHDDPRQDTQPPVTGCRPLYIRFMNSLGGYNFWLFPVYDVTDKSDDQGVIENELDIFDDNLGYKNKTTITAVTNVNKRYYGLFRDLILSPVVQVYNESEEFGSGLWVQVQNNTSSFTHSDTEPVQEVTMSFDMNFNINPTTIW